MKIIVDTNRIIAGLLKDSTCRKILLNENFDFYTPEFLLEEIENHQNMILEKSSLNENTLQIVFELILERIKVVPKSKFYKYYQEGINIIGGVDMDDVPFISLALSMSNDGIWSEDKDFRKQKRIRIWSTKELINIINVA